MPELYKDDKEVHKLETLWVGKEIWEIYQTEKGGEWRWRRTHENRRITGKSSEGYHNKQECVENARKPGLVGELIKSS